MGTVAPSFSALITTVFPPRGAAPPHSGEKSAAGWPSACWTFVSDMLLSHSWLWRNALSRRNGRAASRGPSLLLWGSRGEGNTIQRRSVLLCVAGDRGSECRESAE